jgi:hypothetical protein
MCVDPIGFALHGAQNLAWHLIASQSATIEFIMEEKMKR